MASCAQGKFYGGQNDSIDEKYQIAIKYPRVLISGYHHIKYRNLIFVFQRENPTNNNTSLVTGDCILVKLWYYSPNGFQVNMSSIHIEISIKVFIQKN